MLKNMKYLEISIDTSFSSCFELLKIHIHYDINAFIHTMC